MLFAIQYIHLILYMWFDFLLGIPQKNSPQPEACDAAQWRASFLPTGFVGADFPEHDPAHSGHLDLSCIAQVRPLSLDIL